MEQATKNRLENSAKNGWDFDFNKYFTQSFKFFGRNAGEYIGITLIFIVINIALSFIPIVGSIAQSVIITPCLMMGFAVFVYLQYFEKQRSFNNFFDGFKFIGNGALASLLIFVITGIIGGILALSFGLLGSLWEVIQMSQKLKSNPDDAEAFIEFLKALPMGRIAIIILIMAVISMLMGFVYSLIVLCKANAIEALIYSFRLVLKNFLQIFLFNILMGLVLMVGSLITCGLGFLVFYPVFVIAQNLMVIDAAGFKEDENSSLNSVSHNSEVLDS